MPENLTPYLPLSAGGTRKLTAWMWADFARVFRKADRVTTPTETAAQLIRPLLRQPVTALSCGIDLRRFNPYNRGDYLRARYRIPEKPIILFVGRLDHEKHVDRVINAFALAGGADACLVLVGTGMERARLDALVAGLDLKERVVFTGFVPDHDLPKLYALAECFVMAGTAELQSIATMEAMASGLPVIAARAGALPELVEDCVNGFMFEPTCIPMLAEKIEMVMGNPGLRRLMGHASLKRISVHDIRKTTAAYVALYAEEIAHAAAT